MLSAYFVRNVKFVPRIHPPTSPEIWLFQIIVVPLHTVKTKFAIMELKFTLKDTKETQTLQMTQAARSAPANIAEGNVEVTDRKSLVVIQGRRRLY